MMKKYIALLLALVMLLLAACGTAQPPVDEQTPTTEVTEPSGTESTQGDPTDAADTAETPTELSTEAPTDEPTEEPTEKPTEGDSSGTGGNETTEPTTKPTEGTQPPETEPPVEVTVKLNKSSITLNVGETATLTATTTGSGTLSWASSNTSVATVNSNGKVTAKAAGSATITVTYGGKSAKCTVTVNKVETPAEVKLSLNKTSMTLDIGGTSTITATYSGASGKPSWSSSNTSVATVDSNGKVTAKAAGSAVITATYGGKNAQCVVTVNKPATPTEPPAEVTLKVRPGSMELYLGETATFTATYSGASGKPTWESSDTSVATVDENGKVTAKAVGTAIIKVSYGGKTIKAAVTVYEPAPTEPEKGKAEQVWKSSNNGSWSVGCVGNSLSFNAGGRTADGDQMRVTATSSNTGVATVSESANGSSSRLTVSFKGTGSVTITLTSVDGAASTSFTINVKSYSAQNASTPEAYVNAMNYVIGMNDCSVHAGGSYTVLTLSDADLTWGSALAQGQGLAHRAYTVGGKTAACTYEGVNEEGKHIFHLHSY